MSVWMYVIRELEDAIDDCNSECEIDECNDDQVHAWDEAVAFYVGSEAKSSGDGGYMPYTLGQKRCLDFGTCLKTGTEVGMAGVNSEIFKHFRQGKQNILLGNCAAAKEDVARIISLMAVPLIQGTLRYAYAMDKQNDTGEKAEAKGATFAASVLPLLNFCSEADADIVYENMRVGNGGTASFLVVKQAFERNYECLGITCADVGGLVDAVTGGYLDDASPCGSVSNIFATETASTSGPTPAATLTAAPTRATSPTTSDAMTVTTLEPSSMQSQSPSFVSTAAAPALTIPLPTCRVYMVISDGNRDNQLTSAEYVTFLNRLSRNQYATVAFTALPLELQTNFNTLAALTAPSTSLNVTGASPAQFASTGPAQKAYLEKMCTDTQVALISATTTTSSPTASPTLDENKPVDALVATESPSTLPSMKPPSPSSIRPEHETATPLGPAEVPVGSAMPIEAPTLPIGSNPFVTAPPESQPGTLGPTSPVLTQQFGDVLTAVPSVSPSAISTGTPVEPTLQVPTESPNPFVGINPDVLPDSESQSGNVRSPSPSATTTTPSTETTVGGVSNTADVSGTPPPVLAYSNDPQPTASPLAVVVVIVDTAFEVFNTADLTATALAIPENAAILIQAFSDFVANLLQSIASQQERRLGSRDRRLEITLKPGSTQIVSIIDVPCRSSSMPEGAACQDVLGEYSLMVVGEDKGTVLDTYSQATTDAIRDGQLQASLDQRDPNTLFAVEGPVMGSKDDNRLVLLVILLCCLLGIFGIGLLVLSHRMRAQQELIPETVENDEPGASAKFLNENSDLQLERSQDSARAFPPEIPRDAEEFATTSAVNVILPAQPRGAECDLERSMDDATADLEATPLMTTASVEADDRREESCDQSQPLEIKNMAENDEYAEDDDDNDYMEQKRAAGTGGVVWEDEGEHADKVNQETGNHEEWEECSAAELQVEHTNNTGILLGMEHANNTYKLDQINARKQDGSGRQAMNDDEDNGAAENWNGEAWEDAIQSFRSALDQI